MKEHGFNRNQGMVYFVYILLSIRLSWALYRSDVTASSLIETFTDFALFGHVISSQLTEGMAACSKLCLSNGECLSFNFKTTKELWDEGLCQLNNARRWANKNLSLAPQQGYVYGEFIDLKADPYTFTSLGAEGPNGPTKSQLSGYNGTNLEGQVNIKQGIQYWTVPFSGTYVIETLGASGGNGTSHDSATWNLGGMGAKIKGTFHFSKGTTLKILVGQRGLPTESFFQRPGGGGGGTFVTYKDNTKIIIAGGGGGGGLAKPNYQDGEPGQAIENGTQHGGHDGLGGLLYNTQTFDSSGIKASSGAGYRGDGYSSQLSEGAYSFLKGGRGGMSFVDALKNGGFGGGGYGMTHGGGGGGYSGGGVTGSMTSGASGGGGSYNSGCFQVNKVGVNKGDGRVIITRIL
ncbi:ALK tyrosine kinase receptor-like isoform X2 [Acropora millepora]|uniref:ALK tyrosine kinase receptor-like isoform X2 n=1 Tax=Acropora millepora TaxID=45264 RepID=UPI001CF37494|nr:ALK tyrosine kinase receptor-like isoform X2 [Acropora millepora]